MAKKKNADKAKPKPNKPANRVTVNSAPAAVGSKIGNAGVPKITNAADGSCVITHKEYMQDVTGLTGDGSTALIAINPQRSNVFTWLTAIATRFEQYRFDKLKFIYKPSTGTSTNGYVIMGFDFDSYDQDTANSSSFPGKAEMLTWKYSSKSAPWQEMALNISQDSRMATMRYCDFGNRGDKRLDILGNLCLRVVTPTSNMFVGELFVEYTVRFRQPSYKIPPALYGTYANNVPWTSGSNWFAPGSTQAGNMNITVVDDNKILLNDVGDFLFNVVTSATSGTTNAPTMTASIPTTAPSSSFVSEVLTAGFAGNYSNAAYRVAVEVAPVLLTFAQESGTGITGTIYASTYKK